MRENFQNKVLGKWRSLGGKIIGQELGQRDGVSEVILARFQKRMC